jgi:carboxypeptidase C (cathepsin A)
VEFAKDLAFKGLFKKERSHSPTSNEDSCPQSVSGHRIDALPYWAETTPLPCMYSGHLLSSDSYENFFFYWLHPKPAASLKSEGAEASPLIVYLNGGPGSSSMNALWTGNGPLRVKETGSGVEGEDFEITYDTTLSWADAGDLLWID